RATTEKFSASKTAIKIFSERRFMLPASYIRAYPAKVFPALWHFSHDQTDVIFSACKTEE
ncbi:TPA: hypothetical protein ACOEL4_004930, partial [Enterobacter cloacae]